MTAKVVTIHTATTVFAIKLTLLLQYYLRPHFHATL